MLNGTRNIGSVSREGGIAVLHKIFPFRFLYPVVQTSPHNLSFSFKKQHNAQRYYRHHK